MVVCPVCEHAQVAGGECEVCGRLLSGSSEAPAIPSLEGLEPTRLAEAFTAPAEQPLPELEPTRLGPVTAPPESVPGLEPTRAADVAVEAEPVPGLERTEGDPLSWEERTPLILAPACRYCGAAAGQGEVICGRCGMRLPVLLQPAASSGALARTEARCPSCGTLGLSEICSGCGGRVRFP